MNYNKESIYILQYMKDISEFSREILDDLYAKEDPYNIDMKSGIVYLNSGTDISNLKDGDKDEK